MNRVCANQNGCARDMVRINETVAMLRELAREIPTRIDTLLENRNA